MSIILFIIFLIALGIAFGMLSFRAWELRTGRVVAQSHETSPVPDLSFRKVEKTALYVIKYTIQAIVFTGAKYWFITATKTRKGIEEKLPEVHAFFKKKPRTKPSFVRRSIIESKVKIKKIKEHVKKEHGTVLEEQKVDDSTDSQTMQ